MNSNLSSLEMYCSLAKNFLRFRETIGALIFGFTLCCKEYFSFGYIVGNALNIIKWSLIYCFDHSYPLQ